MAEDAPFSRPVRVDSIPADGVSHAIEANEAERLVLAERNGLPAIARLSATFDVSRAGRGIVRVRGLVHAEVTQSCVVTLEPIEAVFDEPVDIRFAAKPREPTGRRASEPVERPETVSIGDEDAPDPIVDGKIDLGAIAAEFMILGLDPYPRKPGASFDMVSEASKAKTPFSDLELPRKSKNGDST